MHPDGGGPLQLLLQRLGEPAGPVRAHLDLGTDDLPREVGRHRSLGATVLHAEDGFTALQDSTGRSYCVTQNPPGPLPVAVH